MRVLLALIITMSAAHADMIRYHPGGPGALALRMARSPQVIDGPCLSACAWSFVTNPRACFTRRAVFWFHEFADPSSLDTKATRKIAETALRWWKARAPSYVIEGEGIDATRMAKFEPGKRCK